MNILLADDHVLFRSGMRYILAELGEDMEIDEVGTGEELVAAARKNSYDLVLMDMLMPGMNQCDVITTIKDLHPSLPIIIISMLDSSSVIRSAVAAGASGFIPKTSTSEIMTEAIRLVLAGGVYLPPAVLGPEGEGRQDEDSPASSLSDAHLTRQQRAVLAELSLGKSNKEIAQSLAISEATVKVHLAAIMRTLKVRNRTQVVLAAREHNLLS
ncbi:MAG: response regulator transcription factor [Alphaproteobacteria bacterium]|nr:response regulator transcription factor [Alphaproteobacteria bacterium]